LSNSSSVISLAGFSLGNLMLSKSFSGI
jgi:hypothetical protein